MSLLKWHMIGEEESAPVEYGLISTDVISAGDVEIHMHEGFTDVVNSTFSINGGGGGVYDITLTDAQNFTGSLMSIAQLSALDNVKTFVGLTNVVDFAYGTITQGRGLAVSEDGDVIAMRQDDLDIHDGNTAVILTTVANLDFTTTAYAMCVNPSDGLLYVAQSNGGANSEVYVYTVGSASNITSITGLAALIRGICFDQDGNMITAHDGSPSMAYKYAGATNTVTDSIELPGAEVHGIAWYAVP